VAGVGFLVLTPRGGNSVVETTTLGNGLSRALALATTAPPASPGAATPTATPTPTPAPTTTKPPAAVAVVPGGGRIPGGLSGITAGSLSQVQAWEKFRGTPVNVVQTFADLTSWDTMVHPWLGSGPEKFSTFNGRWVISEAFFPDDGGDMGTCANGGYAAKWNQFGSWLTAQGRPDTIVRLAWEANGDWFPWSVGKTDTSTWIRCFQQVVTAIRATDPKVRIDWTLNAHSGGLDAYPGNGYVDIVGIDTYDHWPPSLTQATFDQQCHEATGLCAVIAFARAHGRQFSVPEWGLVGKQDTGAGAAGQAGGDNPLYIRAMYNVLHANSDDLAYEAYFSDASPDNVHSSLVNPDENPNSAALYAQLW
jgi:hypothetical protein